MTPSVSVGLPIFNGAAYLREALDSVLSQTYDDFELIVSDNASTDETAEICRDYAARDSRLRVFRAEANRGASWNHNYAVELARGRFFKWIAADDMIAPQFLELCVAELEREPDVVLCHSGTLEVDERGEVLSSYRHGLRLSSPEVPERFHDLINVGYMCYEVYGVIRTDALRAAGPLGSFVESDVLLLAKLGLRGRFRLLDQDLFLHREHPDRSVNVYPRHYDRAVWFDPVAAKRNQFPTWRFLSEYARGIARTPLTPGERARCYRALAVWTNHARTAFLRDFKVAGERLLDRPPA